MGVRLGAGILGALAVAAAAAGWWALGALVLAALVAAGARQTVAEPYGRALRGLRAAARLGLLVVFATVFAAYVVPASPQLGAAGFVAVVTVADAAGVRLNASWRRWLAGTLMLAAAAFVALCMAIPTVAPGGGGPGFDPAGLLAAAAVLLPLLGGMDRVRLAGATVVALAVAAAALYQLGPVRLGLSPTSLRDVLAAADASVLEPLLAIVVVLATGAAALLALGEARQAAGSGGRLGASLTFGVVAALVAAVLNPMWALLLAAVLALAEVLVATLRAREHRVVAVATAVLAVALLGGLAALALR